MYLMVFRILLLLLLCFTPGLIAAQESIAKIDFQKFITQGNDALGNCNFSLAIESFADALNVAAEIRDISFRERAKNKLIEAHGLTAKAFQQQIDLLNITLEQRDKISELKVRSEKMLTAINSGISGELALQIPGNLSQGLTYARNAKVILQEIDSASAFIENVFRKAVRMNETRILNQHAAPVYKIATLGPMPMFAMISRDRQVKLFDFGGLNKGVLRGHEDLILAYDWNRTDLATASRDGSVILYEVLPDQIDQKCIFNQHRSPVLFARFFPAGDRLLSGSRNGKSIIWDTKGRVIKTLMHNDEVLDGQISKDGSRFLTRTFNQAVLWDADGRAIDSTALPSNPLKNAFFLGNSSMAFVHFFDGSAFVWDSTGRKIPVPENTGKIKKAVSSELPGAAADFLTVSFENEVALWTIEKGSIKLLVNDHEPSSLPGDKAVFSHTDSLLAVRNGNQLLIYHYDGGLLATLDGHRQGITGFAFSGDGQRLLSWSEDSTARVWDLTGNQLFMQQHESAVTSACFSTDGNYILSLSRDGTVKTCPLPEFVMESWGK